MTKFNRFFVSFLIAGLFAVYAPASNAEDQPPPQSYGTKVGQKASRAFANLGTAWLEIPKNMINVTNQSNVFYGAVGGLFKGLVHTAGRLGVAVADLITIPLPTRPIAHPIYIWENFDIDTTYGDTFRYDPAQNTAQPQLVVPAAAPQTARSVVTPPASEMNYSDPNTNRKLDSMFKKEMMK
jgi:putative exosortase-associated protein (TIGR04073 family)